MKVKHSPKERDSTSSSLLLSRRLLCRNQSKGAEILIDQSFGFSQAQAEMEALLKAKEEEMKKREEEFLQRMNKLKQDEEAKKDAELKNMRKTLAMQHENELQVWDSGCRGV